MTDDQKYGMIEAIAHLLNRDYEEIIEDFVSLEFIPPETDLVELRSRIAYADVCGRMLTYAHVCLCLSNSFRQRLTSSSSGPAYDDVCSRMLTYADVC